MTDDHLPAPRNTYGDEIHEAREGRIIGDAERAVLERAAKGNNDRYGRLFLAALSGIPWVLPFSIIANFKGELDQDAMNHALQYWLTEHEGRVHELINTVGEIAERLDRFGDDVQQRMESPEYLALVRSAFKAWSDAETPEKRQMLKKLLLAAGAINLCPDDQIRLFIDWIERYHEAHFAVMKEIYLHQPITKGQIWDNIHPDGRPRDNSSMAGLFGYLIRELNMGGIIHQHREVNANGQTLRAPRRPSTPSNRSETLESPFEDTKEWELSELGKEFVRYVMEDVDPQLGMGTGALDR